jgi:cytoskeletal protein CcmA (bactofilin family)
MRALVNRKVTNKNVKSNNVLAKFLYPPIFNGDLIVVSDLYVNGTTHLTNLDVSGNLYVAENVDVSGNLVLDGSLNVSGNTILDGTLDVSGNITCDQSIVAQKFVTGQVANMRILNKTDIGQAATTTLIAAATTTIFTYSYTPKCANSYIVVDYQTKYFFGGGNADSLYAYAYVNDGTDNRVGETYQQWIDAQGGGTRSGTIFPIVGRYSNANKTAKTIRVDVFNNTNDTVTVTGDDIMTFLKITEIGKSSTPS